MERVSTSNKSKYQEDPVTHTRNIETKEKKKQDYHFYLPTSRSGSQSMSYHSEKYDTSENSKFKQYIKKYIMKTTKISSFCNIGTKWINGMAREKYSKRIWSMSKNQMKRITHHKRWGNAPNIRSCHKASYFCCQNYSSKKDRYENNESYATPILPSIARRNPSSVHQISHS